jgi:hypothetical protein
MAAAHSACRRDDVPPAPRRVSAEASLSEILRQYHVLPESLEKSFSCNTDWLDVSVAGLEDVGHGVSPPPGLESETAHSRSTASANTTRPMPRHDAATSYSFRTSGSPADIDELNNQFVSGTCASNIADAKDVPLVHVRSYDRYLPSIGSALHSTGRCKPCAFFLKEGCNSDGLCRFCHIDGANEKRKKKQRKAARRSGRTAVGVPS